MKMNLERATEDTRQRILQAAMHLFSQVGYVQASTRAIAHAAGVNEVTLFRHFGSKKNLLQACMELFNASGFIGRFETELTGNYADDILRMANLQVEDTSTNFEVLRLLICDARHVPELREALLAGGRGNLARMSRYFQHQIDAGVVRADIPAEVMASAFDSLFSSYVLFENLFQGGMVPQLASETYIRWTVDLFVRGTLATQDL